MQPAFERLYIRPRPRLLSYTERNVAEEGENYGHVRTYICAIERGKGGGITSGVWSNSPPHHNVGQAGGGVGEAEEPERQRNHVCEEQSAPSEDVEE